MALLLELIHELSEVIGEGYWLWRSHIGQHQVPCGIGKVRILELALGRTLSDLKLLKYYRLATWLKRNCLGNSSKRRTLTLKLSFFSLYSLLKQVSSGFETVCGTDSSWRSSRESSQVGRRSPFGAYPNSSKAHSASISN